MIIEFYANLKKDAWLRLFYDFFDIVYGKIYDIKEEKSTVAPFKKDEVLGREQRG